MFRSLLIALPVLLFWSSWASAQTLTTKDLDARIEKQLYEVLTLGTDIYNRGSHDACFRLYQGSLMSIAGFLDHRPDQVLKLNKALRATRPKAHRVSLKKWAPWVIRAMLITTPNSRPPASQA